MYRWLLAAILLLIRTSYSTMALDYPADYEEDVMVVDKGTSVLFECNVTFYQGVRHLLRWYRDRSIIYEQFSGFKPFVHPLYRERAYLTNGSHLLLQTVVSGDDGNYTCQVHFIDGQSFVYQQSTVMLIRDAPEWAYTPPTPMTGVKGGTLNIQCRAIGVPPPVLTWYRDGTRLVDSEDIRLNNTHLQVRNLDQEDVGRYRCMATNGYGHIVYTTAVILEGGTLITQFPRNMTIAEGQGARFDCGATADPNNITYNWFKDGVNVNVIDIFKKRVSVHSDGSLNFNTVRRSDGGLYKCVAWNGISSSFSAEASLTVTYTPKIDNDKIPSNLYFAIGQSGTIPCPVSANPPVSSVQWGKFPSTSSMVNGLLDLNSPRYSLTRDYSLIINNVTESDTGTYHCVAHNEFGQDTGRGVVMWAKYPPYFTVSPEPTYNAKTKDSVTLPCQANPPANNQRAYRTPDMTWRKIGGVLPESSRRHMDNGNLTIYDVRKKDGGMYECVAMFNDVSAVASTELVIESTTPHAPYNLSARFGHFDIYISWKAGFDGGFPQNFVVSFREFGAASNKWQTVDEHIEKSEYTVYDLTPQTKYEIRVMSRNKLGNGMYSPTVSGMTLGYIENKVNALPTNALGKLIFPHIDKPLGPEPTIPSSFSVHHDSSGGVTASWEHPEDSPVPILYYKVEYRPATSTQWTTDSPVLVNETVTTFIPEGVDTSKIEKYYFRVRSYALLAYSDHSEAKILFLPDEVDVKVLSQGAIIGIAIAALIFVAMLVVVVVVVLDALPCSKNKKKSRKFPADARMQYSKATKYSTNGSSQWQSYYPYYGGRFALDGEADQIFVTEQSKQNTLNSNTSDNRLDTSNSRKEQGWYFPRDGHPETDLIQTNLDNYYNPSSTRGTASNYTTYNGLMHGYYDARAGVQMSPSIRNYPYSGLVVDDLPDGYIANYPPEIQTPYFSNSSYPYSHSNSATNALAEPPLQESQSQSTQQHDDNDISWFAPYAQPNDSDPNSPLSPIKVPCGPKQEVLLKPSLPRHSSMKPYVPSFEVGDEQAAPFDPSLSTVREVDTPVLEDYYNLPLQEHSPDHSTRNWVKEQTPELYAGSKPDTMHHEREGPSAMSPVHVMVDSYLRRNQVNKPDLEHRSSVGSSVQEMKAHYNRDRLLGTVEKVRSNSSRSRRPGSLASANSYNSQLSPLSPFTSGGPTRYQYSPFLELEPERYPELTSPVYYNNNNNRNSYYTRRPSPQHTYLHSSSQPNSGYDATKRDYINSYPSQSGLGIDRGLSSLSRQASSYQTSGLGASVSQSRLNNSAFTARPSLSVNTTSDNEQGSISRNCRYFGLYATPTPPQQLLRQGSYSSTWNKYNPQHYLPPSPGTTSNSSSKSKQRQKRVNRAPPSDSVDENYEFDPILIDSEPHDFFHIHEDNLSPGLGSQPKRFNNNVVMYDIPRRPLYAEQTHSVLNPESQRFEKLRNEYLTYREHHHEAVSPPHHRRLHRLESDIL